MVRARAPHQLAEWHFTPKSVTTAARQRLRGGGLQVCDASSASAAEGAAMIGATAPRRASSSTQRASVAASRSKWPSGRTVASLHAIDRSSTASRQSTATRRGQSRDPDAARSARRTGPGSAAIETPVRPARRGEVAAAASEHVLTRVVRQDDAPASVGSGSERRRGLCETPRAASEQRRDRLCWPAVGGRDIVMCIPAPSPI